MKATEENFAQIDRRQQENNRPVDMFQQFRNK